MKHTMRRIQVINRRRILPARTALKEYKIPSDFDIYEYNVSRDINIYFQMHSPYFYTHRHIIWYGKNIDLLIFILTHNKHSLTLHS